MPLCSCMNDGGSVRIEIPRGTAELDYTMAGMQGTCMGYDIRAI